VDSLRSVLLSFVDWEKRELAVQGGSDTTPSNKEGGKVRTKGVFTNKWERVRTEEGECKVRLGSTPQTRRAPRILSYPIRTLFHK